MKKNVIGALALAALACVSGAAAQLRAGAVEVAEAEAVVKLVSVDPKAHTAVVQGPGGATFTINIPREAQNLDRVKPGDLFRMRYVESLAVALHKGGSPSNSFGKTVELAPKGGTPGGRIVAAQEVTAKVDALDRAARTLTLRLEGAPALTVKVAPEIRSFDEVAVGDTISVSYIEALAMEMVREAPDR